MSLQTIRNDGLLVDVYLQWVLTFGCRYSWLLKIKSHVLYKCAQSPGYPFYRTLGGDPDPVWMWWQNGTSVHLPGIEPILSGCPASSLVQSQVFVDHRLYEACHWSYSDCRMWPSTATDCMRPAIDLILIVECDRAQPQTVWGLPLILFWL